MDYNYRRNSLEYAEEKSGSLTRTNENEKERKKALYDLATKSLP